MIQPVTVVIGAVVGLLVGLTGMGGASLMTPLLVLVLGVKPVLAVGTDLLYSSVTKAFGTAVHMKQQTVEPRVAGRLLRGSVPGALLGVLVLGLLQRRLDTNTLNSLVLHLLGFMLIAVAAVMVVRLVLTGRVSPDAAPPRLERRIRWLLPSAGFVVGFLVGLTSVGSGTLIVVVLSLSTRLSASRLVGTDLLHGVVLTAVAGIAHFALGNVNLRLTAGLLIGSIPGVLIGSRLCVYLPERSVRVAIAATLLVSGLRLV